MITKKEGNSRAEGIRYKARLVAKGFIQQKGTLYDEIFSLVVLHTFIRVILAIIAQQDLELEQQDVKTDFLTWRVRRRNLYVSAKGFWACILQVKKVFIWSETSPKWYKDLTIT